MHLLIGYAVCYGQVIKSSGEGKSYIMQYNQEWEGAEKGLYAIYVIYQ